jgi:hypothetical protein
MTEKKNEKPIRRGMISSNDLSASQRKVGIDRMISSVNLNQPQSKKSEKKEK